ncbi:hypothetical protein [Vibrio anguillarum]|uniref:hypothetical protein n=1 Tax=Vibrio anguillarum TaxID=55601 RepID=UPI0012FDC4CA|nr:hypothetical protein [Vibrio anguillarum]
MTILIWMVNLEPLGSRAGVGVNTMPKISQNINYGILEIIRKSILTKQQWS